MERVSETPTLFVLERVPIFERCSGWTSATMQSALPSVPGATAGGHSRMRVDIRRFGIRRDGLCVGSCRGVGHGRPRRPRSRPIRWCRPPLRRRRHPVPHLPRVDGSSGRRSGGTARRGPRRDTSSGEPRCAAAGSDDGSRRDRDPKRPNLSYLKDLWHAVQNQEISGKEALVLGLAQRGMNTPVPGQVPGPNVPIAPQAPGPHRRPPDRVVPVPSAVPGGPGAPIGPVGPVPAAGPVGSAPAPAALQRCGPEAGQAGTLATGIRSTRAGTCLCHGVPAYSSRHCDEVSSLGATPGTTARPSPSV